MCNKYPESLIFQATILFLYKTNLESKEPHDK